MAKSSFDRIKRHLDKKGSNAPVSAALRDDLEMVVRRCEEVRSLADAEVELSPYMQSLLRVTAQGGRDAAAESFAPRVAAAGV